MGALPSTKNFKLCLDSESFKLSAFLQYHLKMGFLRDSSP